MHNSLYCIGIFLNFSSDNHLLASIMSDFLSSVSLIHLLLLILQLILLETNFEVELYDDTIFS